MVMCRWNGYYDWPPTEAALVDAVPLQVTRSQLAWRDIPEDPLLMRTAGWPTG